MMNNILHFYWLINLAILFSYVFARMTLGISIIKRRISQSQQLRYARHCLLISLALFPLMPIIMTSHPLQTISSEFHPAFQHVSLMIASSQDTVINQIGKVNQTTMHIPIKYILFIGWLFGFISFLYRYIQSVMQLHNLRQQAFCRHQIYRIHLLFSSDAHVVFCWSSLRHHFVMLPIALLSHSQDMRIALHHEFQHLRQGDTYWLQLMAILKLFCFWNPLMTRWITWLKELQEFACDENIILSNKTSATAYAQCLLQTAKTLPTPALQQVAAMHGMSKSLLYRRINMLFVYRKKARYLSMVIAYLISLCCIASTAFALNATPYAGSISKQSITTIINASDNPLQISATPEVLAEINRLRSNEKDRSAMLAALTRMKQYQQGIQTALKKNAMPADLQAIPLVESGYQPLDEKVNPVLAAGIWQIIPSTARRYGLVVNHQRDDRFNTPLATQAALSYLNTCYQQFHDWKLAVLAYEIGEKETARLINMTGSRDAWTLARASQYKSELLKYLASFDAAVIIIHYPSILNA